jgi:diadenylate cyclase
MIGTRGIQLVKGFLMLGTFALLASAMNLQLVSWFFGRSLLALVIAIPMVFQPELRKMLEEIGRGTLWRPRMGSEEAESLSHEITAAMGYMKANKIGALIVLQKNTGLKDPLKVAILTGFLACDELQRVYDRQAADQELGEHEDRETEAITAKLIARIDEILKPDSVGNKK